MEGGMGKYREGRGGRGRDKGGKGREGRNGGWAGEGSGTRHAPPRDKLWIRPWSRVNIEDYIRACVAYVILACNITQIVYH